MSLADNLLEIIRIDHELERLLHSTTVIPLSDLHEVKRLKKLRRDNVAVIQNYKAPSTGW